MFYRLYYFNTRFISTRFLTSHISCIRSLVMKCCLQMIFFFVRSFDHYMKPEKRRCIQAVRKTKLISFFALYSIRFSILCNIITGSVQHSVYCIQRKESDKYIRVCIYNFFSLRSGASNVVRTIRCI